MALSYQFSRLRTTKRRWKSVNPRLHFRSRSFSCPFSPFRSRFSCAIIEDEVNPMTHEQNERLLTLLSEYLCFQADAITPADVAAFSADAHLPQEDAYRMLLSAKLGLDPDRAEDWLLIRDALPKIIRRCDPRRLRAGRISPPHRPHQRAARSRNADAGRDSADGAVRPG